MIRNVQTWFLSIIIASTSLTCPPSLADGIREVNEDYYSSAFLLPRSPKKKRTFIIPPLVSLILPGFDQWIEGQYTPALFYTGGAAGAFAYALATNDHDDSRHKNLGSQLFTAFGAYSLYHSFRSAVKTRQAHGEFLFLKHEESPSEILTAPFNVKYFSRMTTVIPVTVALGIAFLGASGTFRDINTSQFSLSDAYFATSRSYLAGTWEEVAFRGWMMPVSMHYMNSEFFSNFFTSAVFGAAHYNGRFIPWPQFAMGLYLGYVSQKNEWTLGESIFIHTWWDLIIFMAGYLDDSSSASIRLPTLHFSF